MREGKTGYKKATGLILFGAVFVIMASVAFAGIAPSPFAESSASQASQPAAAQKLKEKRIGVERSASPANLAVPVGPRPECKISAYAFIQGDTCSGPNLGQNIVVTPGGIVKEISKTQCPATAGKNAWEATSVAKKITWIIDVINSGGAATASNDPISVITFLTTGGPLLKQGTESIAPLAPGAANKKQISYSRDMQNLPAGQVTLSVNMNYGGKAKSCTHSFTLQK